MLSSPDDNSQETGPYPDRVEFKVKPWDPRNPFPAHGAHNGNSEFGLQLDSKTEFRKGWQLQLYEAFGRAAGI
jgi:hypothetical protein